MAFPYVFKGIRLHLGSHSIQSWRRGFRPSGRRPFVPAREGSRLLPTSCGCVITDITLLRSSQARPTLVCCRDHEAIVLVYDVRDGLATPGVNSSGKKVGYHVTHDRVDVTVPAFFRLWTNPSAKVFETQVDAWMVCPRRRTMTRLIECMSRAAQAYQDDHYHRWFRAAPRPAPQVLDAYRPRGGFFRG